MELKRITRAAIVGTAQSWVRTPWNDPSIHIVGINDGYLCRDELGRGPLRADAWYELHPLDMMFFRPKDKREVHAKDIPKGHYVRPEGHADWLKQQAKTIEVWLQKDPPEDWPVNAKRLPVEDLEAKYGAYWASGPAYEVLHLMDRGCTELHIYGIHLATQQEYVEQRPNFEFLLGRYLGAKCTMTEKDGLRYYEGDRLLVLPKASPILQHGWKYALEHRPQPPENPQLVQMRAEIAKVRKEKQALIEALVTWPRFKSKGDALDRLRRLSVLETDLAQQIQRANLNSTVPQVGFAAA